MAIPKIPNRVGYEVFRRSSFDKAAYGKLTSANHLESLMDSNPDDYDKAIMSVYTQTGMKSNDFIQMVNKATPYTTDSGSWKWKMGIPYKYPRITHIPATTLTKLNNGVCGQDDDIFEFVSDKPFFVTQLITPSKMQYPAQWYVIADSEPAGIHSGFLVRCKLVSNSPLDSVPAKYLKVGIELQGDDNLIGEFDQKLAGVRMEGETMELMETMSGGFGFEHTITAWADSKTLKKDGKPLDLLIYAKYQTDDMGTPTIIDSRWEPEIERRFRMAMESARAHRMIWSPGGRVKNEATGEIVKAPEGIWWKIKNNGNYHPYNRGQFSIPFLRAIIGDIFYRRVAMADRKVVMFTNEAGFDVFESANWNDLQRMGFTLDAGSSEKFIQGSGRNMVVNYAIGSVVTRETGKIELRHLTELDLPQTQLEYGQNKKSTPKFMIFNIDPMSDGTPSDIMREVRLTGQPGQTWGYVDGRRHHLGFAASKGHSSANKFPGYTMYIEDRADIFIEDLSKMILIEERPEE